jgi:uncharacterized protein YdeI (YjbR/CyaY-like superfamily)
MDKSVDRYIATSADFAKPILTHLRKLIHEACPYVVETIKWSHPHFEYKGVMCNMASFKNHCAFGFWKAALMKDAASLKNNNASAMGHMGKLKSLADLPSDKVLKSLIKEAMRLNEEGVKLPERKKKDPQEDIMVPESLQKELVKHRKAAATFHNFSPSHKREYVEWINEAKSEETIKKRVLTTIEWLTEGKSRHWKYQKK